MKPKDAPVARTGFGRWVNSVRALWKWLDLDELLFGFFCGAAVANFAWYMWTVVHSG